MSLEQCLSTGGLQPTGGPRSSLSGPYDFSHFSKKKKKHQNFRYKFQKIVNSQPYQAKKHTEKQLNYLILTQLQVRKSNTCSKDVW